MAHQSGIEGGRLTRIRREVGPGIRARRAGKNFREGGCGVLARTQRRQAPLLLHRLQKRTVIHLAIHDRVPGDVLRHHHHWYADAQPFEIEALLSLSGVEAFGIWGRDLRRWRRSDVIIAAAVLIERDYEQSVLPVASVWALRVSDCLINFPDELIAQQHAARPAIGIDQ